MAGYSKLVEYMGAVGLPKMFPREVCEFQMPMISPLFPFPNQLAITVTTPGQPVDWNMPQATWMKMRYHRLWIPRLKAMPNMTVSRPDISIPTAKK